MTDTVGGIIDLSSLTEKQLAKEYKSAGKDIKSKDPDVRSNVLLKLKDSRYFTVGGCLSPLVECLVPKKKLSDDNKKLLGVLDTFVGPPIFAGSSNADIIHQSLRNILSTGGDLEFFHIISDLALFREEVKVVKPKKGQPIEIIPENEIAIYLRNTSLKALCSIVISLSSPNKVDPVLSAALSAVKGLIDSICLVLLHLRARFEDQPTKDGMIQEGIWAIITLIFVLRNNSSSMAVLLASDAIEVLLLFAKEESFSLYCMQVFELISLSTDSAALKFLNEQLVSRIADAVLRASDDLSTRVDVAPGVSFGSPGGSGSVKKEKPAKKEKAPLVTDQSTRIEVGAVKQSPRQNLACINVAANTLAAICNKNGSAVTIEIVTRLVQYFSKVLSDKAAWDLAQSPAAEPFDVNLCDTFDKCCICIGDIGLINAEQRRAAYEANAVPILLSIMQNSMTTFNCTLPNTIVIPPPTEDITTTGKGAKGKEKAPPPGKGGPKIPEVVKPTVGTPEEEAEKLRKVRGLRRVAEKALLSILSEKALESLTETSMESGLESDPGSGPGSMRRWNSSAVTHAVDLFLFTPPAPADEDTEDLSPGVTAVFPLLQLMELIASPDIDLGNRGIRMFSALVEGVKDPISLLSQLNLDVAVITNLSNAVHARAIIVLDMFEKRLEAEVLEREILRNMSNQSTEGIEAAEIKESLDLDSMSPKGTNNNNNNNNKEESNQGVQQGSAFGAEDCLLPKEGEALYLSLIILERALSLSSINVNIFATKDRLSACASLLCRCGPTMAQKDGDQLGSSPSSSPSSLPSLPSTSEYEVNLFDPRIYPWAPFGLNITCDKVLLRPLLFDVLSAIASAEGRYRSKEEPPVNGSPLLTFTSVCKEAALCVGKLCGDAIVSTILVGGRYHLTSKSSQVIVLANNGGNNGGIGENSDNGGVNGVNGCVALHQSVLDAALSSLLSIISSGATGIYSVLESVVDAGFNTKELKPNNNEYSTMHGLKKFLSNLSLGDVLGVEVEEGDDVSIAAAVELKGSLSNKTIWSRSLLFDQLFTPSFTLTPSAILKNPIMWPYISICASVLGVVTTVGSPHRTVAMAVDIINKLSRVESLPDTSQPVVADSFGAFFLAMGGALAVASALGRFGTLRSSVNTTEDQVEIHQRGISFLTYLIGRGREREVYWLSKVPAVDPTIILDPKAVKAAALAKEKAKEKDIKEKAKEKEGKQKGKSFMKVEGASILDDIVWNLEPDDKHPDPNHGPTRGFWRGLLETVADELHTLCESSTFLLVALQGGLSGIVLSLIDEEAGVHISDGGKVTPLMYALSLGDVQSASALITAGADIDAIDAEGTPTVTYACHSILPIDLDPTLFGPVGEAGEKGHTCVNGSFDLIPLLLDAGVDVCVCSTQGNSPILSSMGLGNITVVIGGYKIAIGNSSYTDTCPREMTLAVVSSFINANAFVNGCNHGGVVPLHIAAARGHRELIDLLKVSGASANAEDNDGYVPLHYLAAACPDDAPAIFDIMMSFSMNRPVQKMVFSDLRTGRSKGEKYEVDIARKMNDIFEETLQTSSIRSLRLTEQDLMNKRANDGMNIVLLCMTASALKVPPFVLLSCGEKHERMELIDHLIQKYGKSFSIMSNVDNFGMTAIHAATLLFHGLTPQNVLTPQQIRSKRVKSYPSLELRILDGLISEQGLNISGLCTRSVPLKGFNSSPPMSWTSLHGAIANDNSDLLDTLLRAAWDDFSNHFYGHFLASSSAGGVVCEQIVSACASSSSHSVLLNSTGEPNYNARPLHLATRSRNTLAVSRLLKCSKVDPNLRDDVSGMTAVHEACHTGDLNVLRTFGDVSDRLDLLMVDVDGKTCIEIALDTRNIAMLHLLVKMRRNDVLEKVLHARPGTPDTPSILVQLELENIMLANGLEYVIEEHSEGYVEEKSEEHSSQLDQIDLSINESMKRMEIEEDPPIAIDQEKADTSPEILSEDIDDVTITKIIPTVEMLEISNQIVKILVLAAFEAGINSQEFHAHPCFAKGLLYTEFITRT